MQVLNDDANGNRRKYLRLRRRLTEREQLIKAGCFGDDYQHITRLDLGIAMRDDQLPFATDTGDDAIGRPGYFADLLIGTRRSWLDHQLFNPGAGG